MKKKVITLLVIILLIAFIPLFALNIEIFNILLLYCMSPFFIKHLSNSLNFFQNKIINMSSLVLYFNLAIMYSMR